MIPKNNNKIVIVLCGHGSRNPNYKKHLIIFKKEIKKKSTIFIFFIALLKLIYSKSLKKYQKKNSYNFLITSCSPSKKIKVLDELKEYTKDIAKINRFDRSAFFQVGQEDIIFKKIKKASSDKPLNIILHPIFLFKGFLYEKVCENFKKKFKNVRILKPIASQKELTLIIRNKLLHTLNFVD